jgi:hypothetical protein
MVRSLWIWSVETNVDATSFDDELIPRGERLESSG